MGFSGWGLVRSVSLSAVLFPSLDSRRRRVTLVKVLHPQVGDGSEDLRADFFLLVQSIKQRRRPRARHRGSRDCTRAE